jgi:hypothetical protein
VAGDFVVTGAEDLVVLARRLKAVAAGELRKELLRGIREGNKSTIADIKSNALGILPNRGGLAQLVAQSRIATRTRSTGKQAGIRIVAENTNRLGGINKGRVKHPVFGNRGHWASQQVRPGWFTDPIEKNAPAIRAGVERVMRDVAAKIERN